MIDNNPRQLKLDFALWTARGVRKLIVDRLNKHLSLTTVRRYLRSWGMTPQRPKKKAIQQDDAAVKQWIETEYPAIAQRAKKENATIFWEDETAVQQDTNWVRGYDFIRFLHRLIQENREAGRKLFVICDNCRVHHAKLVQAWCEKHKDEIELFFLPAYSPELNPDEFINRQLKTQLRLHAPRNHAKTLELAKEITTDFKLRQSPIRACFEVESTLYAKAA